MKRFLHRAPKHPSVLTMGLCLVLGCQTASPPPAGEAARRGPRPPFGELEPAATTRIEALAQFATGVSLQLTKGFDAALPHYREAVRLNPHNVKHGVELAKLLLSRKQVEDAMRLLNELAATNPRTAEPHFLLGVAHTSREEPDQARAEFDQAYRLDPTHLDTLKALLHLYLKTGETEAAATLLDRALKIQSDQAGYWLGLGDLCLATRGKEPSLATRLTIDRLATCFTKGLELATGDDDADPAGFLARLARLHDENGDPEKAARYYQRLVTLQPDDVAAQLKLANWYLTKGEKEKAASALEQVIKLEPLRFVPIYNELANVYEELGQDERAISTYQQSIAVKPDQLLPYLRMTLIHLQHDRFKMAQATLETARQKFPQAYQVAYYRGLAFSEEKDYEQALAAFAEATDLAAKSTEPVELPASFYFYYGSACERAGQIDKAATLFKRTIELAPNDHAAHNYLGYMWAEKGIHLEEAHQLIRRAVALEPDNGAYLDSLGWVLFQLGEPEKALKHLERAAVLIGKDPVIFEHLAEVLLALGRPQEARPYLEQALQLDPENKKLQEKLDKLKHESAVTNRAGLTRPRPARFQ